MSRSSDTPSIPVVSASISPQEAQPLCRKWFEAYGTAVYNCFRFHIPLPDVAEDLTAEPFLKVPRANRKLVLRPRGMAL